MSGKHFTLLAAALLMFAACSEDVTDIVQDTPANDPLAGYDGPLSVNISFGSTTRTTTNIGTRYDADAVVDSHPFPTTSFSQKDTVGIVQVVAKNGIISKVFNFMAVTANSGTTWAIKDVYGQDTIVRHFLGRENTYFAYSPYKAGGLVEGTDFKLSTLPTVEVQKYNEFSEPAGTETVTTPAYKFFEKMIDRVLGEHPSQSTLDDFKACDLLGARGVATTDMTARTATLNFALDHILALDILALKKLDGNLTIYGAYDTWVAPNNNIWRMKQQMRPTVVNRSQVSDFPNADAVSSWYHDASTTGDYQFYMQLVKDRTPRTRIGNAKTFAEGGWLVDIPAVPAGQYAVVTNPYFRFFREKGFTPSPTNIAGTTWKETWKKYYQDRPYTWTYEEVLFPDVANVYDYNDILEVGDKLLSDGNISKASSSETGVGTVKWIAYAPAPWLSMSSTYQGWHELTFFENYILYSSGTELKHPAFYYDNGYRPYGMEIETGGVKHLSINYTANGCSSLDDFWRTDVCNHFLAFSNSDVTYKSNSDDIKHNDPIFELAIPSVAVHPEGKGLYDYELSISNYLVSGYYPHSWAFLKADWHLNKDSKSGVRSTTAAAGFNGPGSLGTSQWMVPTVAQYFMANYYKNGSKDLLTCNYVPGTGSEKEGMVMLKDGYGFNGMARNYEHPVYVGNGYINLFNGWYDMFSTTNNPLNYHWFYSALPISGVEEASCINSDRTITGTKTVTKDKLNITNNSRQMIVYSVPTDYTPCICY